MNRTSLFLLFSVIVSFAAQAAPQLIYVPLKKPCRIVNTRNSVSAASELTAFSDIRLIQSFRAWGSKAEMGAQGGVSDAAQLAACQPASGMIPAAMGANITAVAQNHQSRGNVTAFPYGTSTPTTSLINFQSNNIANSAILTLNPDSTEHFNIDVQMFSEFPEFPQREAVDVVVDVMGYFYPQTTFEGQAQRPGMAYVPLATPCRVGGYAGF